MTCPELLDQADFGKLNTTTELVLNTTTEVIANPVAPTSNAEGSCSIVLWQSIFGIVAVLLVLSLLLNIFLLIQRSQNKRAQG